ncbi:SH3 domain-containing protein [Crossiella sp. NPDC003009]
MKHTTAATTVLGMITALALTGVAQASAAPAAPTEAVQTVGDRAPAPDGSRPTACFKALTWLHVRTAPNNSAPIVGRLAPGEKVQASVQVTAGFRMLWNNRIRWTGAAYLVKC